MALLLNKGILLVILVCGVVITLISGSIYWSKEKAESLHEKSQWIVENTKQLSVQPRKDGSEIVPDNYLHMYVDAALGKLDKAKMRNLMDNYCYAIERRCAEVNLVFANLLLSKSRVDDEKSLQSARNSLAITEKFYSENAEHSSV